MRDMRHGRGEDPRDEMGDYPANRHNQSGTNHSSSNVSSTKKAYTSSIYVRDGEGASHLKNTKRKIDFVETRK